MLNAKTKHKILIIDDNPLNIRILVESLKNEFQIIIAINGEKGIELATSSDPPDLILLDIMMPGIDGYEVCRRLKKHHITEKIPIIFLTALAREENEYKGLSLGAVDYITKPINKEIVKARIYTHVELKTYREKLEFLVKEQTREILEGKMDIVFRLARAAEYRDNETGMHITRMSHYCAILGKAYGMSDEECDMLFHASSMHDVGKIGIPDRILLKPGRLEPEEFSIMKTHTTIGGELLHTEGSSDLLYMAKTIALTHHEKWDGSGYPNGITGNDIPIHGRIAAICDVFDALTSERPYKKAWPIEKAIEEIKSQSGIHFDPELVDLFMNHLSLILDTKNQFSDHIPSNECNPS